MLLSDVAIFHTGVRSGTRRYLAMLPFSTLVSEVGLHTAAAFTHFASQALQPHVGEGTKYLVERDQFLSDLQHILVESVRKQSSLWSQVTHMHSIL